MRSRVLCWFTALVALAGCSSSVTPYGDIKPRPTSVAPSAGYPTEPVAIVIEGTNFLTTVVQPSSGGTPWVDTTHRAWLGNDANPHLVELTGVTWVSKSMLSATVPPNALPAGAYTLTVQNALEEEGSLAGAYTVLAASALPASLAFDHPTVNVGQTLTLTLTLTNSGAASVTGLTLGTPAVTSADGGAARPTGAAPAASSIESGQTLTYSWTYQPTAPGHVSITVTASGTDSGTGKPISATLAAPASAVIQRPAELTAVVDVSSSVAVGRDFMVTLTVDNTGDATARAVTPTAPAATISGTSGASATLKSPPAPASSDIPGGSSAQFTWVYATGSARGTLQVGGGAAGTDGNDPSRALAATAPAKAVTVAQAAIDASVKTAPSTVTTNQQFTVVITIRNPGTADVTNFQLNDPVLSSGVTISANPAAPTTLPAGGQAIDFTWTVTAATAGNATIALNPSGVDSSVNQPITGQAVVHMAVTGPPSLTALAWSASAPASDINQPVTVTLTLGNATGSSTANVTAVAPTIAPAGAGACSAVAPAPPTPIAAGGSATFTWTCHASAAGVYTLGATMTATDANNGMVVAGPPLAPIDVTFTQQLPVSVMVNGTGSGAVSSSPAGINNCSATGGTCSGSFTNGSTVTLTASPGTGSSVAWSGCTASGNTCTIANIAAATNVTATLTLATPGVTVSVGGTGSGTVSSSPAGITSCSASGGTCSANFNYGTSVTLTATPGTGSSVTWSGCTPGAGNTCVIASVTAATGVTATFTLQTFSVSVSLSGTGTLTSSPADSFACAATTCSGTYSYGQQVILTATPIAPATAVAFTGCDSMDATTCTLNALTTSRTVTATFTP